MVEGYGASHLHAEAARQHGANAAAASAQGAYGTAIGEKFKVDSFAFKVVIDVQ